MSRWIIYYGITYPILLDQTDAIWNQYGMDYIPHNVLIDGGGIVRYTNYGYDEETLIDLIAEYQPDVTEIEDNVADISRTFAFISNYPNPFNATTVISYQVPAENDVTLRVYDVNGRLVQTLVDNHQPEGKYSLTFNGENLQSGVFFCELVVGSKREIRKLVLLK